MKTLIVITTFALALWSAGLVAGAPGERVSLQQHLGARLPLQQRFRDEQGRERPLGGYFSNRPVILLFAYYNCPNLCDTVLSGAFQALIKTGLTAGRDYELVVVDIDPGETPADGLNKKRLLTDRYRLPGGNSHAHFLTGNQGGIDAVTGAAGFQYYYDEDLRQYAHAAGLLVASPDGRLSRYLYGVRFDPQDLRLALVQAADNRIGSAVDQLLLLCFHYDPQTGKYGLLIMQVLRLAGALAVVLLGGFILLALRRERRRKVPL